MIKSILAITASGFLFSALGSCKKQEALQAVRTFSVTDFNQIESAGFLEIQVVKNYSFGVKAEGNPTDLGCLEVEVTGRKLRISCNNAGLRGTVKITVAMPVLDGFYFSDRIQATISGFTHSSEVEGKLRNFSKAIVQMNVSQISVEANGNSELVLDGQAEKVYIVADNNSTVNAYRMPAVFGTALANRNAEVKIQVSNTINASATERSIIFFKGNPVNRFTAEMDNSQIIEE